MNKSQMDATYKRNIPRNKREFTVKTGEPPIRFKSRLATLGFLHDMSMIGETYAPTICPAIVHIFLILQDFFSLDVLMDDSAGAFL